jgi:cyanophycinase-like exopeptidase
MTADDTTSGEIHTTPDTHPPGTVALVGAGEYLPDMEPVDRPLLARLPTPPRVLVLPTAAAPDGPGVPERWANMGVEHFTRLGAAVEPLMLLTRADADRSDYARQIAAANFIYLSGGKPRYLLETLRDTNCWRAMRAVHAAGGVVAGCSAGAMALGGEVFDFPRPWPTLAGLGLVPGVLVIPHFDELPRYLSAALSAAPHRSTVVGVDGMTALVCSSGEGLVLGRGRVVVIAGRHRTEYRSGDRLPLPPAPSP